MPRDLLRQKPGGRSRIPQTPSNILLKDHIVTNYSEPCNMSVNSSGAMLRRTILNTRLAAHPTAAESSFRSFRPSAFASYRTLHHSARIPTITASEARHRPTLRPSHQPARVTGLSPGSKRMIFIQTENTPNPDVSFPIPKARSETNQKQTIGLEIHP